MGEELLFLGHPLLPELRGTNEGAVVGEAPRQHTSMRVALVYAAGQQRA